MTRFVVFSGGPWHGQIKAITTPGPYQEVAYVHEHSVGFNCAERPKYVAPPDTRIRRAIYKIHEIRWLDQIQWAGTLERDQVD